MVRINKEKTAILIIDMQKWAKYDKYFTEGLLTTWAQLRFSGSK